jgi:hypothetical protein
VKRRKKRMRNKMYFGEKLLSYKPYRSVWAEFLTTTSSHYSRSDRHDRYSSHWSSNKLSKQESGNLYWAGCPGDRLDYPCSYLTPCPISLFPLHVLWLTPFTVIPANVQAVNCFCGSWTWPYEAVWCWFIIANFCKIKVPSKLNKIIYVFRLRSVEQSLFIF